MDHALLREEAQNFADRLNRRVECVLPGRQPTFIAVILGGRRPRLMVAPAWPDDQDRVVEPLTLTVEGRRKAQTLHPRSTFFCCPDSTGRYLTIEESRFSLGLADVPDPILRYEYLRDIQRSTRLPAAHVQVHAHRDETTYLMVHADEGRPGQRWRRQRVPRLSDLHLPVGGDRYRPCLEDVITLAANELGARLKPGAWRALDEGRAEWRRLQLAAAVRDAPEIAARVLQEQGWQVAPGPSANREERPSRLSEI